MSTDGTRRATGRSFWGPDARLLELIDDRATYMALQVHREHRSARPLVDLIDRLDFLRAPDVPGLAPVVDYRPESATLLYATGPVWPLVQLVSATRQAHAPPRARAALEFMAHTARLLEQAVRAGHRHELYSHGSLNPWRLLVDPEGRPVVIGFGLPQLELLTGGKLDVDSYRYCPPERLTEGEEEDLAADLLSLALMGFELITGLPLYDGDAERVRTLAERGLGRERLLRHRDRLETVVIEFLSRALQHHPDARYPDGESFALACLDLASSPLVRGPGIAELMGWIAEHDKGGPTWPPESVAVGVESPHPVEVPRWSARLERPQRSAPQREEPFLDRDRLRRRVEPDHNAMYPTDPLGADALEVQVQVGGELQRARLSPSESLAKSAARLVDVLEFSPVDLTGRIRGWYRIVQGDDAWYGDAPTKVLDFSRPLELDWIPNHELRVILEVTGHDPIGVTLGSAVHAQFLVGEVRRVLALEGTAWRLFLRDRPLDPWQVLDDYGLEDGATLRVDEHRPRRIRRRR